VALLKPETFMNDSGRAVQAAVAFFKLDPDAVLVVHDEGDLELGRLQARLGGGAAGHNGLRSIQQQLGTPDFMRLRIGVGRPGRGDPRKLADFVLADFRPEDDREGLVRAAADAVETLDAEGLEAAQRAINAKRS
jgi:peptidyl-tRNA hydrolase, PTH1 family